MPASSVEEALRLALERAREIGEPVDGDPAELAEELLALARAGWVPSGPPAYADGEIQRLMGEAQALLHGFLRDLYRDASMRLPQVAAEVVAPT